MWGYGAGSITQMGVHTPLTKRISGLAAAKDSVSAKAFFSVSRSKVRDDLFFRPIPPRLKRFTITWEMPSFLISSSVSVMPGAFSRVITSTLQASRGMTPTTIDAAAVAFFHEPGRFVRAS